MVPTCSVLAALHLARPPQTAGRSATPPGHAACANRTAHLISWVEQNTSLAVPPCRHVQELSLPNPLWHQGSGISVTSSFQDGDASLPAAGSLKEALRHAAQEALRHLSAAAHKEGRGGSLASPGPTPTHAGGAAAAAAALAHAAAASPASQPVAEAAAAHHPPLATTPTAAAADGSRPPLPQQQQEEGAGERQPPVGGDEGQDAGTSR